jgi:hypothetical protein
MTDCYDVPEDSRVHVFVGRPLPERCACGGLGKTPELREREGLPPKPGWAQVATARDAR